MNATATDELLSIKNLTVEYRQHDRYVAAVRDVSLSLGKAETLGIVGESGCGKSTLALAIMGLLPTRESRLSAGSLVFNGADLTAHSAEDWRKIRGAGIAMIFQDPFSSLNPVLKIDYQINECFRLEGGKPDEKRAEELLSLVQLPTPDRILRSYPHQLSGGQRQRVMIAIALARHPSLLIADEPTTALDVTVQNEILKLLESLQKRLGMAMIFVTHNIGVVKRIAARTAVMYAGQIVEHGFTDDVLSRPQHPYTQELLRSLPRLTGTTGPLPVLEGTPPEPGAIPSGCPFHPRCPKIMDVCRSEDPSERRAGASLARCHLYPK